MLNLYPTIRKLEKLQSDTDGRGTSFPNMLQEVADFRENVLQNLILDLQDQQRAADKMQSRIDELEACVDELEMKLEPEYPDQQAGLNYEIEKAIEEGLYASVAVS